MRIWGFLFFLDYLQSFDLLEGEAHYAAVLALVLEVDCLLVVVNEDLRRNPAAVVEPLCPLGDVFVLYLLGLLAHPRLLLPSLVFLYPEEALYIPQRRFLRPYSSECVEEAFSEVAPALVTIHTCLFVQCGGTDEARPL
jgi:hypothetical protein